MLEHWKFALDELNGLHARQRETPSAFEHDIIDEEIRDFREEIQVNKELWPLLVYSWDEDS